MKQEQDTATIWMGRQMKWETDGEKQMIEDKHKGEQAKESDTITKTDWWLKTNELGDRWIGKHMARDKWWKHMMMTVMMMVMVMIDDDRRTMIDERWQVNDDRWSMIDDTWTMNYEIW